MSKVNDVVGKVLSKTSSTLTKTVGGTGDILVTTVSHTLDAIFNTFTVAARKLNAILDMLLYSLTRIKDAINRAVGEDEPPL